MCGILGTNFNSQNFQDALSLLYDRGPDYQSFKSFENFTLGHTRLSIIDLDSEANQPMEFDNVVLVFNGEIYNYNELIKDESLICCTKSDSEVIIRLYQKYGTFFLNKLNGMFSFVIYDKTKKVLFGARDRYGKKPLFYFHDKEKFIFSSSLKSIIKILGFTPKLNKIALSQYFQYFVPIDEQTFYTGINKLNSSTFFTYDGKEFITKKYYKIKTYKAIHDESTALDKIEDTLFKSIESRLVSDVEVGTLLSGGIDSSLVSTLYSKISGKRINTFSIGYSDYKNYSELDYADIVAKDINSYHHKIEISKKEFLEVFDDTLFALDEPHADSAAFPLFYLCRYIKDSGIKTLLSGEGSDELFLGYDNYAKFLKYYDFKKSLDSNQQSFLNDIIIALQNNTKESEYLRRIVKDENLYNSFGEIYTTSQKRRLFKKVPFYKQENTKNDPVDWMSYIDLKIWLGESLLTKVDRISMANSIELRTPFLDYRLVDLVFSIDSSIKVGDTNKYLLKKIASKYIPSEIVNRTKKGFNPPYNEWIFDEYRDSLLNTVLLVNKETNLFNEDYLIKIYHLAKEGKFKQHFWSLYIFSKWFINNS